MVKIKKQKKTYVVTYKIWDIPVRVAFSDFIKAYIFSLQVMKNLQQQQN